MLNTTSGLNELLIPYSILQLTAERESNAVNIVFITSNLEDGAYALEHDILIELDIDLYYWIKQLNLEIDDLENLLAA